MPRLNNTYNPGKFEQNCPCPVYNEVGDFLEDGCTLEVVTAETSFTMLVTKELIQDFVREMLRFCHNVTSITRIDDDICTGEATEWTYCKDGYIGVSDLSVAEEACDPKLLNSISGCESREKFLQTIELSHLAFYSIFAVVLAASMWCCKRTPELNQRRKATETPYGAISDNETQGLGIT